MTAIRRIDSQDGSKNEQREAVIKALTEHKGNVRQTALAAGLSRSRLNDLVELYELRPLVSELRQAAGWTGGRPIGARDSRPRSRRSK